LTFNITGLPAGAAAKVSYDGATGRHAVTGSSVPLAAGVYAILADPVTVTDPIVGTVYRATAAPSACVRSGAATSVDVAYAAVPVSNKLWALNGNGQAELLAFPSASLQASGSAPAALSGRVEIPRGLAFDQNGGLWATANVGGASALAHYPAEALAVSGALTPDVTISGAALNVGAPSVAALTFDSKGNLWVSAPASKKILGFAAASLKASGSPDPFVTISDVGGPSALAFDASGNLWAASDNAVVEYVTSRLVAGVVSSAPDVVLNAQTPSPVVTPFQSPAGLAFDAANNLWVNYNGGAIVRFTAAERTSSSTLTPAVQVTLDVAALAEGLAFDESGGLWFAYSAGKIARLAPAQLTASAKITPATILSSASVASAGSLAFYPAPAALPLFGKVP
jgi:sugar lactone lactonase YvrE